MKFKIDENLPGEIALAFRDAGWDCRTVAEQDLGGGDDARIGEACSSEQRILVTLDRGFSNIRRYAYLHSIGVIVFRLRSQDKRHVLTVTGRLVTALSDRELRSELWIVHESRIRIRAIRRDDRLADRPPNSA